MHDRNLTHIRLKISMYIKSCYKNIYLITASYYLLSIAAYQNTTMIDNVLIINLLLYEVHQLYPYVPKEDQHHYGQSVHKQQFFYNAVLINQAYR